MAASARQAAVSALVQVHQQHGYSNIVLDNLLKTTALSPPEQALASRLFYGVIERRLTLDYVLSQCASVPLKKMHPCVTDILRTGAYQLLFMDKIPASAAVNEAVKLTRVMKQGAASGFVNGVLRGVQRRGAALLEQLPDNDEGLELRYSCPRALIALWREAYGTETAHKLVTHINDVPDTCLRINLLQTSVAFFREMLETAQIPYELEPHLPACIRVSQLPLLKRLAQNAKNWYYHQDAASQICCAALSAQPGERIADVCAAPGGKSFTTAQYMENTGSLLSGDIYAAKCDAMEKRAQQLGITILKTVVRDASAPCPEPLRASFDRVICDVPCSGLGVIRRKPEIRYKDLASFASLPELQYRILEQAAQLVKPGGVLQYSTCTLNPAENERVASFFLAQHPEFSPRPLPLEPWFEAAGLPVSWQLMLLPHVHHTDGFYIAGFVKTG